MVFNLHKFEPPQIMQPSFTFLTALLHTLHLLYLGSKFYLHSQLCQLCCYLVRIGLPSSCQKLFSSPPPLPSTLERGWSVIWAVQSLMQFMRTLVLTWIWLLTFLSYCDNDSRLLFSVRDGGSKFLIKDTRYKATFYFCCDKKKSHILQIKCRTLKYWHILIVHNAEVLLRFTLKLQLKMYKKEKKKNQPTKLLKKEPAGTSSCGMFKKLAY